MRHALFFSRALRDNAIDSGQPRNWQRVEALPKAERARFLPVLERPCSARSDVVASVTDPVGSDCLQEGRHR